MINTYKDIITNQVILNKVSRKLNSAKTAREYGRSYSVSAAKLKDAIKISTQQNSQAFKKHIKKIMAVNNVTIVSVRRHRIARHSLMLSYLLWLEQYLAYC